MERLQQLFHRTRPLAGFGVTVLVGLVELVNRLWVSSVFWHSGMTKLATWSSTLYLFNYEYHVPLLPPDFAAYLGTAIEVGMPVFIALGLGGRVAAGILFLFNFTAAMSYPALTAEGISFHQIWGLMILVVVMRGPGLFSLDRLIGFLASKRSRLPRRRMKEASAY